MPNLITLGSLRAVMISELDLRTIVSKFDSRWVPHIFLSFFWILRERFRLVYLRAFQHFMGCLMLTFNFYIFDYNHNYIFSAPLYFLNCAFYLSIIICLHTVVWFCREEENLVFCFGALFNSTLNFTQSGWLIPFSPDLHFRLAKRVSGQTHSLRLETATRTDVSLVAPA